jgi:hypothetical protein
MLPSQICVLLFQRGNGGSSSAMDGPASGGPQRMKIRDSQQDERSAVVARLLPVQQSSAGSFDRFTFPRKVYRP